MTFVLALIALWLVLRWWVAHRRKLKAAQYFQAALSGLQQRSLSPANQIEAGLVNAMVQAVNNLDAVQPWLNDPELGQVAQVWKGAGLFSKGRKAEALDCFDEVLAEPPSPAAEDFFRRYSLPVPFHAAGMDTTVIMGRSMAAIYAAICFQGTGDSENALAAVEQAEDSDLVTTLKSTYTFNLDRYDDTLSVTQQVPRPAQTPLQAFSLTLRGCALREQGQLDEAVATLNQAVAAAGSAPEVFNRLQFEIGRTLVAQGRTEEARRKFLEVKANNPRFPGLDSALSGLPLR